MIREICSTWLAINTISVWELQWETCRPEERVVTVKRFVGMGDNDIELFFALGGPGLMDEILFERAMVAAGGQGSKSVLYYVNISSGRNSIGGGMTLVALAS